MCHSSTDDLRFWGEEEGNILPHELQKGGAETFCGAWHVTQDDKLKSTTIPPHWRHLKLDKMLEECLITGTFPGHWESSSGKVVLYDSNEKYKKPVFLFEPDGKPIQWPERVDTPNFGRVLFALAFIAELRRLLLRGWKTTYRPRRAALNGRVKGRILVGPSIREGAARGKPYITVCELLERSPDHPVNRIFRYTLKKCRGILQRAQFARSEFSQTWSHLRQCDEKLTSVTMPRHVTSADFKDPALRGFYRRHGHVLALAKAVVRSDYAVASQSSMAAKVVPFLLYTPYLFEKWIAARAQNVIKTNGLDWELTHLANWTSVGPFSLNADLVFKKKESHSPVRVLDAKYKECWSEFPEEDYKFSRDCQPDLHQILAYQTVYKAEKVGLIYPSKAVEEGEIKDLSEKGGAKLSLLSVDYGNIDDALKKFLRV